MGSRDRCRGAADRDGGTAAAAPHAMSASGDAATPEAGDTPPPVPVRDHTAWMQDHPDDYR
ncbi:hypothetical protein HHX38_25070 [Streptomyces sp. PKU-MA01144]|uniref:hypothetical protein n=1 Tax=Streptomyces sp. PKU-MA01144 TaxID=2729138 RepID=UPI00147B4577|nr:hypothetical protein [Streptomyces sp. PKU-MA01144]NNJ07372.1 hypothetical protein [Streptomyces sp. PKU-MA01144]